MYVLYKFCVTFQKLGEFSSSGFNLVAIKFVSALKKITIRKYLIIKRKKVGPKLTSEQVRAK